MALANDPDFAVDPAQIADPAQITDPGQATDPAQPRGGHAGHYATLGRCRIQHLGPRLQPDPCVPCAIRSSSRCTRTRSRTPGPVEEIDFSDDLTDLDRKLMPSEKHLISRLVAFFATGDSIVANNLVLNLYEHINSPEARACTVSRQPLRRGAACPVLPEPPRQLHPRRRRAGRSLRGYRQHPLDPGEGGVLLQVDGLCGQRPPCRLPRTADGS